MWFILCQNRCPHGMIWGMQILFFIQTHVAATPTWECCKLLAIKLPFQIMALSLKASEIKDNLREREHWYNVSDHWVISIQWVGYPKKTGLRTAGLIQGDIQQRSKNLSDAQRGSFKLGALGNQRRWWDTQLSATWWDTWLTKEWGVPTAGALGIPYWQPQPPSQVCLDWPCVTLWWIIPQQRVPGCVHLSLKGLD